MDHTHTATKETRATVCSTSYSMLQAAGSSFPGIPSGIINCRSSTINKKSTQVTISREECPASNSNCGVAKRPEEKSGEGRDDRPTPMEPGCGLGFEHCEVVDERVRVTTALPTYTGVGVGSRATCKCVVSYQV